MARLILSLLVATQLWASCYPSRACEKLDPPRSVLFTGKPVAQSKVERGDYTLGTNLELEVQRGKVTLAPRSESVAKVVVNGGEVVTGASFTCTTAGRLRTIQVRVRDRDGKPAANVFVESPYGKYRDSRPDRVFMPADVLTSAEGIATARIAEGAMMNLVARRDQTDSEICEIGTSGSTAVTLRFR